MVGVQKECRTCKKFFMTRSTNSARWESQCYECYSNSQKNKQMVRFQERETNIVNSLENRIVKVEDWMDNIPSIIGAEVNNTMNSIISDDLLSAIEEKNAEKVASLTSDLFTQIEQFEEKIQRQISLLNTRIVKIMKEMD